jgi:S-adenosylmethionine hydrolase
MKKITLLFVLQFFFNWIFSQNKIIVFQTDFGLKDGAVSAMKGVAMNIDTSLKLFDLTHEIPAYNIWEAAFRLNQTVPYWPAGTVFVSVVDPGVGTDRKSVVIKTTAGHYLVGPDNGTFTLITETEGIDEVREIDEAVNRRKGSEQSYTFHGRDVYAYTAAKLASGKISMEQVGKQLPQNVVRINYQKAIIDGVKIKGNIPAHDVQYGNIWTNITSEMIQKLGIISGDMIKIVISNKSKAVFIGSIPFASTFGEVAVGKPLAYYNSLMQLSFALNQDNFAETFKIKNGGDWNVEVFATKKKVN